MTLWSDFSGCVSSRLREIDELAGSGGLDEAVSVMVDGIDRGGLLQAFGTGHSEAFAMEIAGRAGGLIPSHAIRLQDLVLLGSRPPASLDSPQTERDPGIVDELYQLYRLHPADVFLIASNSGVNGAVVGLALRARAAGHPVIAVTSLEHSSRVAAKHPSGRKLSEVADVVLDNRAPYGDTVLPLAGDLAVGAVSSITAAYLAQLLTIGVAERFVARGDTPPLYISANTPRGDGHNQALEERYGARIKTYSAHG